MTITKEEIEAIIAECDKLSEAINRSRWGDIEAGTQRLEEMLRREFVREFAALALEALSSREAGWQGEIKPLEWIKPYGAESMRKAETIVGTYRVWTHHEAAGWWFWDLRDGPSIVDKKARTQQECFDHAKADYEARIRSALLPTPPDQGSRA